MTQDHTFNKNYSYEIDCMRHFLKLCYHENSAVRYSITDSLVKVVYYDDDIDLFDVDKAILKQVLKRCECHQKGWNINPKILVSNATTNMAISFFQKCLSI